MIKVIDSGMVLVFLILSCSFLTYLQINDYKLENFSIFGGVLFFLTLVVGIYLLIKIWT
ncbi:hypothetical protein A5881_003970 [Enterococcus termitis]